MIRITFTLLLVLIFTVSNLAAQAEIITVENVTQVELLAQVGWYDELHVFDRKADLLWPAWVIAFNQDGTRFALGNDNNEVVLFDVINEAPFIANGRVLLAHEGPVYSLAFHPDGIHLASGSSDGMIYVWDMETGEVSETIESNPHSAIYGLTYSPDGEELHCATFLGHGMAKKYTEDTLCFTHSEENSAIYSLTFNADGTLFAYGDTVISNLENFTSLTLQTRRSWSDSYKSSRSKLIFSADDSVLLNGGTNQDAYVWHMNDLANGLRLQEGLLAISPDGSLLAGHNLIIVDTITGETLLSLESPDLRFPQDAYFENLPRDAVFNPSGTLIVTANINGSIRFWGIPTD